MIRKRQMGVKRRHRASWCRYFCFLLSNHLEIMIHVYSGEYWKRLSIRMDDFGLVLFPKTYFVNEMILSYHEVHMHYSKNLKISILPFYNLNFQFLFYPFTSTIYLSSERMQLLFKWSSGIVFFSMSFYTVLYVYYSLSLHVNIELEMPFVSFYCEIPYLASSFDWNGAFIWKLRQMSWLFPFL